MNVEMRVDEFKTYTLHNVTYNSQDNKRTYFKDNDSGELFKVTTSTIVRMYEDEDEDEIFEDCVEKADTSMTVADLLNKTDVETGGLIITIYYPNAYFEATIGHNKINRNSELYKRFIKAYGDMIVDEVSFDIKDDYAVVMRIKVDYAD